MYFYSTAILSLFHLSSLSHLLDALALYYPVVSCFKYVLVHLGVEASNDIIYNGKTLAYKCVSCIHALLSLSLSLSFSLLSLVL